MEGGGTARERDRVGNAGDGGELALEGVDVRPERRDPVRLDRLCDELRLAAGEVGWGQVDARHRAPSVPSRGARACADGDTSAMAGHGMIFLGFGKYVRADRIYALEPITGDDRGSGSRTLVWVEGIPEPVVASRTQETILAEIEAIADPSTFSRRSRSRRGALRVHPQLFEE